VGGQSVAARASTRSGKGSLFSGIALQGRVVFSFVSEIKEQNRVATRITGQERVQRSESSFFDSPVVASPSSLPGQPANVA
jgi:hypothetical protein